MNAAVILGAGPAGLLLTRVLGRAGVSVTLVRGGGSGVGRPARHHVHVLPASTRRVLESLGIRLGAGHPDRDALDGILEACALRCAQSVLHGRASRIGWDAGGRAEVRTTCGARIEADLLVDATGTARASFAAAAAHARRDLPLEMADGRWRYSSVLLRGSGLPEAGELVAVRDFEAGEGLLLLGTGDGLARATLQTSAAAGPPDLNDLLATAARLGTADGCIHNGSLHRWGPHPVTRAALEGIPELPAGWLPVGDALLVTPPHLAGGVRQAADHAMLVTRGLAAGDTPDQIRHALTVAARAAWLEATMAEALSIL